MEGGGGGDEVESGQAGQLPEGSGRARVAMGSLCTLTEKTHVPTCDRITHRTSASKPGSLSKTGRPLSPCQHHRPGRGTAAHSVKTSRLPGFLFHPVVITGPLE